MEKIKSTGLRYIFACGIPDENPDHANAAIEVFFVGIQFLRTQVAFKIQTALLGYTSSAFTFRIGACSGPVAAGVIGIFIFNH